MEAATAFSNRLVQLCQLTYAALVEAAVREGEKTARKARDGPSTADAVGDFGNAPPIGAAREMSQHAPRAPGGIEAVADSAHSSAARASASDRRLGE